MYDIYQGQNGDDYYAGISKNSLGAAISAASALIIEIKSRGLSTYTYILGPGGRRINPQFNQ